MILRNFIYLDLKMLYEYLSSFDQNFIREKSIEKADREKSIGANKIVTAKYGKTVSEEKQLKFLAEEAASFQNLYNLIDENSLLQVIEEMDDNLWNNIKRQQIIEGLVNIELPKLSSLTEAASEFKPMLDLISSVSDDLIIDDKTQAGLSFLEMFNDPQKGLILKMPLDGYAKFKFYGAINLEYLREDRSKLEGEFTVIGKIVKKIPKGKSERISPLQTIFDKLSYNKKAKQKTKQIKLPNDIEDKIYYPAAKLDILAIYR